MKIEADHRVPGFEERRSSYLEILASPNKYIKEIGERPTISVSLLDPTMIANVGLGTEVTAPLATKA